ncbi:hypothetical protein AruPA_08525 [Acidiphilium sp. PA]|uniref:hypothetical protein n=1 Tax=Acidiphilium sp. PA TaxID=2871705 RepID=UPI00224494C2|nr:hypothetical protein [Acidiphilium sp. PA]MCW8307078.1 hypothetical protein [Acidiphilium sp. PA]
MKNPTAPNPITRTALALGSAVAIAGLVSAAPAQAATSANPCAGGKMGAKSSAKPGHAAMTNKKMKSGACAGK